jgi:hypothetical protein
VTATKKTKAKPPKAPKAPPSVRTLEGKLIPVSQLQHIAPHLRCFAVPVASLAPDAGNARSHGEHDLPATAASLRRFGQQELIQFEPNQSGRSGRSGRRTIKVGNGRFEAATDPAYGLNWTYIAAVPSTLAAAELRAFALVHNRTGERAGWLERELDAALRELGESDEFELADLADLGFEREIERVATELDRELDGSNGAGAGAADAGTGRPLLEQYKLVLSCRDEEHQTQLLDAIENNDGRRDAAGRLAALLKEIPCRALIG